MKILLPYLKSALLNFFSYKISFKRENNFTKFHVKIKILKFQTIGLICVFSAWNIIIENIIVIFEICAVELVYFVEEKKFLNLEPKMPYLDIFEITTFEITKFCVRTKMLKFGTKNALFEYFWVGILKIYCHI